MPINETTLVISAATARALKSICHQNNEGASLYNQGKCVEAIPIFMEAMCASRTSVEQCLEQVGCKTAVKICMSLQVLPSQTAKAPDLAFLSDQSLFPKPFEIEMNLSDEEASFHQEIKHCDIVDRDTYLLFSRMSSILIFNFALAHHAVAITSTTKGIQTGRQNFLSKARDLYCVAYKSLQGEDWQEVINPVLLYLMVQAILNNLSRCYASLDDIENSTACSELLLKSIILFQQDRRSTFVSGAEGDSNSNHQYIDLFLKNIMFLILHDPGFAPAA
ncbi:hypothetical protein IV203_021442 [Nitzschia inconspicua]|uniref:Uncharacterized protein n=1 Tax=Nitzschia inconspicua TaxID=303405 RepID=A0A9K3PDC5_9STRA|nr:hypothetical protein IV203_021442 [Nitzschia inconspicua]